MTLAVLLTACPGGSGDSEPTATAAPTTGGAGETTPTDGGETTPTGSEGTSAGTSAGETAADCSQSRLVASVKLPEDTTCFGVAMDANGGITVLAGEDDSDSYEAELHRIVDGQLAWSLVHPPPDDYVRPFSLALRRDGVAVVAGFASDPASNETLPWTVAYDPDGKVVWEHVDSAEQCAEPPCRKGTNQGVVVTADGEFLVAGERGVYMDFNFKVSGVLRRYDAAIGETEVTEFALPTDDGEEETRAMALRADGGVVLVGESYPEPFSTDVWVAHLNADGSFESIESFNAGDDESVEFVTALSDGSFVLSARADDFYAVRLDAGLNAIWHTETDWYGPVIAGPDDTVYAAVHDFRVVDKLDDEGQPQWADDPCLANYGATALGLSPDGAQLLVCRSDQEGTYVEVYDPS